MIVDSSAIVAVMLDEPEADSFDALIMGALSRKIAAPTLLELALVLTGRFGPEALKGLDEYLAKTGIITIPFTADHAAVARQAFLRYGKGRHPAGLNFGDCISYAAARLEAMPLLFKGDDFRKTDVECAA